MGDGAVAKGRDADAVPRADLDLKVEQKFGVDPAHALTMLKQCL
jgi:hypothetical protein